MTVFTCLMIGISVVFFGIINDRMIIEREAVLTGNIKTNMSSSQLKFEIIDNAKETLSDSEEVTQWADGESLSDYYYNIVRVQKLLRVIVSRVTNVEFELSATYFDMNSLVVTPFASTSKESYFKDELRLNQDQIEGIYNYFDRNNGFRVFKIEREEGIPEICYITKTTYQNRSVLFFYNMSV